MMQGKLCRIKVGNQTVEAVAMGSDNRKSLFLEFDAAIHMPDGGAYLGNMAVLWDEAANCYKDLITGGAVEVTFL